MEQPIKITREEYNQKFGNPIPISRSDYEAKFGDSTKQYNYSSTPFSRAGSDFIDNVSEAISTVPDSIQYNAGKYGSLVNAIPANVLETIGEDSSFFRDNQNYWKDVAKDAESDINKTYKDPLARAVATEVGNPLNYAGGGLKTLLGVVGSDSAGRQSLKEGTTLLQDTGNVIRDMGLGTALYKLLSISPKRALLGGNVKPQPEIDALRSTADKYGVELTPATLTGSDRLGRLEYSVDDGLMGNLGMSQVVSKEKDTINKAIETKLDDMGASYGSGEQFRFAVGETIDTMKQGFNDRYNVILSELGDNIHIGGLKKQAKSIVDEAERVPLMKNSKVYNDAKKILDTDIVVSMDDFQKMKSTLGALTQDTMTTGKASTAPYKQLYGALNEDLQTAVTREGDLFLSKDLEDLNKEFTLFKDMYDGKSTGSRFVNSVMNNKVSPERIGMMINNNSLIANNALRAGGYDTVRGIPVAKETAVNQLLDFVKRGTDGDAVSLARFMKESNKPGFKTAISAGNFKPTEPGITGKGIEPLPIRFNEQPTSLFEGLEDVISINELRTVADAVLKKQGLKNTSKTATYNMINTLKMMNPVQLMGFVGKEALLPLMYRSEGFRNWLSTNSVKPKTDTLQRVIQSGTNSVNQLLDKE